ncbi:MAG: lipid II flippase MurJ, partial [Candidatus Paceibacterota bacterium]
TELDIYYGSFRLPDLIYATIASFVSVTILIPLLSQKISENNLLAAQKLISAVFSVFMVVMIIVSMVAFFVIPFVAPFLTPGFSAEALDKLVLLSRILLLSPFLLGLSNLFGSVTQTYRKFLLYSLCPAFYNLGIITGIIWLYPRWGLAGIVWGVILGALFHLLAQLPAILEYGFWPTFSFHSIKNNFKEIKKVIFISLPRTITLSANQLALMVVVALASVLGKGAISIFNLSYNLQSVPLAIIGVSYSVAAFPTLTNLFTKGRMVEFLTKIREASQHIIFWSLPAMVLFIVLRAQIVRVILGSGEFDWTATRLTAACLAIFTISIVAQNLMQLLVRAYYAGGRTQKPLWVNLFSYLVVIFLAYGLSRFYALSASFQQLIGNLFRVQGLEGASVLMLPLAFSLGSILNVVLLLVLFKKDFGFNLSPLLKTFGRTALSALLGGVVTYQLLNLLNYFFDLNTFVGIFAQGFLAGLGGLISILVVLWFLRSQELSLLIFSLRRKFWKVEVVRPEPEEL